MLGKEGDVLAALAQGGQGDGEDAETVEQVLAKMAGFDFGFQIPVGGGDDARVDFAGMTLADAGDFPFLQGAQQCRRG